MRKQWKALLGCEEHELSNDKNTWISLWHPDMEEYLEGKTANYDVQYRLRHKDGTYRWIRSLSKVTYNQNAQPIRLAGCNLDITDYNRTKEFYFENEKSFEILRRFFSIPVSLLTKMAHTWKCSETNRYSIS